MQTEIWILGIYISDRMKESKQVQSILTKFGCSIKTRLGLHEVTDDYCATSGILILELTGDIMERGITLAGGGSMISGIDKVISGATKMPVWIAEDPLTCVVRGCGICLEDNGLLKKMRVTKGL